MKDPGLFSVSLYVVASRHWSTCLKTDCCVNCSLERGILLKFKSRVRSSLLKLNAVPRADVAKYSGLILASVLTFCTARSNGMCLPSLLYSPGIYQWHAPYNCGYFLSLWNPFLVLQGRHCKREYVKNPFSTQGKKLIFIFFRFHNEELKQCLLLSCLMSESLLKNSKKKYDYFSIWNLFPVIL